MSRDYFLRYPRRGTGEYYRRHVRRLRGGIGHRSAHRLPRVRVGRMGCLRVIALLLANGLLLACVAGCLLVLALPR